MTLQNRVQRLELLSTAMKGWVLGYVGVAVWRHIAPIDRLLRISVSSRGVLANMLLCRVTVDSEASRKELIYKV